VFFILPQTDLQQIKKVAHTFLLLDPKPTGYAFIVKHPYTDNAFVTLEVGKKEYVPANILEDSTAMKKWRENVSRIIENAKNPRHVYMGLTKSYRFAFLKYAMPYMSQKDFSEYLADAWVLCEAPNRDPNFTKRQMIGLFQKADPRILMSDDEYDRLQNLEIITIDAINNYTFFGCASLLSVNLPDTVKSIGDYAYYGCVLISDLNLDNSIETIGKYAFYNCNQVKAIVLPCTVKMVDDYAFRSCSSVKEISLPDSVTTLGDCVFYGCIGLEQAEFGTGITSIGDRVFYACVNLKKLVLNGNVTNIHDLAFYGAEDTVIYSFENEYVEV
jgi:hypothetical protein